MCHQSAWRPHKRNAFFSTSILDIAFSASVGQNISAFISLQVFISFNEACWVLSQASEHGCDSKG